MALIREEVTYPDGRVEIREYPAPDADPVVEPVPQEVSETQFIRACRKSGLITFEEGEAYLARGVLPPIMAEALAKISDKDTREDVILKAVGSASFSRDDRVFSELVKHGAATDEDIDGVFRLAASLT